MANDHHAAKLELTAPWRDSATSHSKWQDAIGRDPPYIEKTDFAVVGERGRKYAFPNVSFDSNGGMTLETFACHAGINAQTRDSCVS